MPHWFSFNEYNRHTRLHPRSALTNCDSLAGDSAIKGFAIVPYIQGIAESIMRILNNCGIKVVLRWLETLFEKCEKSGFEHDIVDYYRVLKGKEYHSGIQK